MVSRIAAVRKLFFLVAALLTLPAAAVTVDRIAAVVDRQVITVSEIAQMVEIRFFPRLAGTDEEHRREVLDALIAQALRYRDVERFGAQEIPPDTIEARVVEIRGRFPSEEEFNAALARTELTLDELRALARRQLQVEAYIQERFAPLVFVTNDEIAEYYESTWRRGRLERGLPVLPLNEVREEVRTAVRSSRLQAEIERWTTQLRARANVDVYAWR
jgi:peptidyl-prolyl cis-trans isomerase SurA